jgi:hypothetical protein
MEEGLNVRSHQIENINNEIEITALVAYPCHPSYLGS